MFGSFQFGFQFISTHQDASFEIHKSVIKKFYFFLHPNFFCTIVRFCILKNHHFEFISSDSCSQGPYTTLSDPGLVDFKFIINIPIFSHSLTVHRQKKHCPFAVLFFIELMIKFLIVYLSNSQPLSTKPVTMHQLQTETFT